MKRTTSYGPDDRDEALRELREELKEFAFDALTLLHEHLREGHVVQGTWAGCVLSYKCGSQGSNRRDRVGRSHNAFTVLYDCGWLTDADVLAEVEREMERRKVRVPAPVATDAERPVGV